MNFNDVAAYLQAEPAVSALGLIVCILAIFAAHLSIRLGRLTKGGDGRSLEGTIRALEQRASALEAYVRKNQTAMADIERRLTRSIRGVALERFDPFREQGGQQSFSAVFLNEAGDGVVISGIHSRDQVRVYAKQVTKFASERKLSEEESHAIRAAQEKLR